MVETLGDNSLLLQPKERIIIMNAKNFWSLPKYPAYCINSFGEAKKQ